MISPTTLTLPTTTSTTNTQTRNGLVLHRMKESSPDQGTAAAAGPRRVIFPSLYDARSVSLSPDRGPSAVTSAGAASPLATSTNTNKKRSCSSSSSDDDDTTTTATSSSKGITISDLPSSIMQEQQQRTKSNHFLLLSPLKKFIAIDIALLFPARLKSRRSTTSSSQAANHTTSSSSQATERQAHRVVSPGQRLPSILRCKLTDKRTNTKFPSVDSDMPSLASSEGQSESDHSLTPPVHCARTISTSTSSSSTTSSSSSSSSSSIAFDARVWVCEFERAPGEHAATWYTSRDLEGFKQEAVQRIVRYTQVQQQQAQQQLQLIPTGTGRFVRRQVVQPAAVAVASRALFSHAALRHNNDGVVTAADAVDDKDVTASKDPNFRQAVLENEIRNILLVDPHDICLTLFTKALKHAMPHVKVTACTSSEAAMEHLFATTAAAGGPEKRTTRFDMIIIEERLKIFHRQHRNGGATERRNGQDHFCAAKDHHASGSALMRVLSGVSGGDNNCCASNNKASTTTTTKSLFVGVSARLGEDGARLKEAGADFCWAKPPPPMNQRLVDDMLKAVLLKRGRSTIVADLFGK